jgi:hypothetical protein
LETKTIRLGPPARLMAARRLTYISQPGFERPGRRVKLVA